MRSFAVITCLLSVALPLPASAIALSGDSSEAKGTADDVFVSCGQSSAEVLRWTPAAGPLASYVADAYLEDSAVFVALGYDGTGFWSAEGDPGNDACDDCSRLYLRHTSFDGRLLSEHKVGQGTDHDPERNDATARRSAIKQKIFSVAKGPLDVTKLQQDFTMRLPKHDTDGHIEQFSGWFAEVKKTDGAVLRFAIVSKSIMCWCSSRWQAYTLAPSKK